jgi:O-antigen ligase
VFLVFAVTTHHLGWAGVAANNGTRAGLTFGDPNLAADYFFVSLMVMVASRRPRRLSLRIPAYAVLLGALAYTGSNGGLVALAVGLATTFTVGTIRKWGWVGAVALVTFMTLAMVGSLALMRSGAIARDLSTSSNATLKYSVARSPESLRERRVLFEESVPLFLRGSPLGSGPGTTELRLADEQASYVKEAHDDYMAALVERGAIGLLGLLALLGAVGLRSWSVSIRPLTAKFAAVVPRPQALMGGVLGLATSGLFYQTLHFRHLWALYGVVAALALWGRER